MTKYEQFLKACNVMSEQEFNEVIDSLPVKEIDPIPILYFDGLDDLSDQDELSRTIIDNILYNWHYVFCDTANFNSKTFDLGDVDSLEDLEEIKNKFEGWTISNYGELKEDLEKDEQLSKEEKEFDNLIDTIKSKADLVQLQKFVETL